MEAGVGWVQVREKDLPAAQLLELVSGFAQMRTGMTTRLLVNSRADVAVAGEADGVHLSMEALPLASLRRKFPQLQILGVSCHNEQEVAQAVTAGADYLLLGPVFATPSKPGAVPLGISRLSKICAQTPIPVFALGGVDRENAQDCTEAGAQGIAGIRLFQQETDLKQLVAEISRL